MIPPTRKVETMFFEESMVANEEWYKSSSWQMTLRLELSKTPCGSFCTIQTSTFQNKTYIGAGVRTHSQIAQQHFRSKNQEKMLSGKCT